jgi:hypothetical protein
MLLLQNTVITEENMRINMLESSGLTNPEKLVVDNVILISDKFLYVIFMETDN